MLTGHKAKAIEDARGASSYTRIRGTLGWLVGWLVGCGTRRELFGVT